MTMPAVRLKEIRAQHAGPADGRCDACDLLAEVDKLRAEVERLRYERRMFRRRLAECLPWVAFIPYPSTREFSEMIACRDLAMDTLAEVPE